MPAAPSTVLLGGRAVPEGPGGRRAPGQAGAGASEGSLPRPELGAGGIARGCPGARQAGGPVWEPREAVQGPGDQQEWGGGQGLR